MHVPSTIRSDGAGCAYTYWHSRRPTPYCKGQAPLVPLMLLPLLDCRNPFWSWALSHLSDCPCHALSGRRPSTQGWMDWFWTDGSRLPPTRRQAKHHPHQHGYLDAAPCAFQTNAAKSHTTSRGRCLLALWGLDGVLGACLWASVLPGVLGLLVVPPPQ